MRVAIRTDASPQIGSGHVMRMLTLASALRSRGATVVFITRERSGDMREAIGRRGFETVSLDCDPAMRDTWLGALYDDEIRAAEEVLRSFAPLDLIVVDHYSIDARWERRMREYTQRIAVVDDLVERAHDCDAFLNQNLGAETADYDSLLPAHALRLLGPRFALLREEFREYSRHARRRDGTVRRVLIFIGGFDASDETSKALRALARIDPPFGQVDVVLPPDAPHAAHVRQLCSDYGFAYRGRVDSIAPLMDAADVSIGAMGSATWERCVMGLPAVVVTVAENQRPAADACARAGAVEWLGDAGGIDEDAISRAVEALRANGARVREMSDRARSVTGAQDGFSTDRVVEAFMGVVNV
jgi:UDP-2,4-diacetamido-2,4,6-trideoxy-beta-L-altropyranose hydrolase